MDIGEKGSPVFLAIFKVCLPLLPLNLSELITSSHSKPLSDSISPILDKAWSTFSKRPLPSKPSLAKELFPNSLQEKNELRITVEDGASKIPSYINELTMNNIDVSSVAASKPTLDDVFLNVTGYRLEGTSEEVSQSPNEQEEN